MCVERTATKVVVAIVCLFVVRPICADTLLRNGEQIALERTREYMAIRLDPLVRATDQALRRAALPGSIIEQTPVLEQHRLVVIREANEPTNTAALVAFGKIMPVYRMSGIYVIPTNEIFVKIAPATQRSVLSSLAKLGKVQPLNSRGTFLLTLSDSTKALEVSNSLSKRTGEIEFAEPNFVTISPVLESKVTGQR